MTVVVGAASVSGARRNKVVASVSAFDAWSV